MTSKRAMDAAADLMTKLDPMAHNLPGHLREFSWLLEKALEAYAAEEREACAEYVSAQAKKAFGRKFNTPEDAEAVLEHTADALRTMGVK